MLAGRTRGISVGFWELGGNLKAACVGPMLISGLRRARQAKGSPVYVRGCGDVDSTLPEHVIFTSHKRMEGGVGLQTCSLVYVDVYDLGSLC